MAGDKAKTSPEIVLEEAEVLPYESIFDWDLQDPLGFYRETERYEELRKEFGDDEMKALVIEGMWRDREKYHILRRFMWPPKGKVFYSRGYYEDYDARPTVNVAELSMSENQKQKEAKMKKGTGFFSLLSKLLASVMDYDEKQGKWKSKMQNSKALPPPVIAGQKKSLTDFDPSSFNRVKLEIKSVPKDTRQSFLKRMFPKAAVKMNVDEKTGFTTCELEFANEEDAAEAFRRARQETIDGEPVILLPRKTGERRSSDDDAFKTVMEYDPDIFDHQTLEVKNIPDGTSISMIKTLFPNSEVELIPDEKTGNLIAILTYSNVSAANDAYKKMKHVSINGGHVKIRPAKKKKKKNKVKELHEFDPEEFDHLVLEVNHVPEGTKEKTFLKMFPSARVTTKPDPATGKLAATLEFDNKKDALEAYRKLQSEDFNGNAVAVAPKKKAAKAIVRKSDPPVESKDKDSKHKKKKEPKHNSISHEKKDLVDYDPESYDLKTLEIKNLPEGTTTFYLQTMFPKGQIKMVPHKKTGELKALVSYDDPKEAAKAFKDNMNTEVKGNLLEMGPKKKDSAKEAKADKGGDEKQKEPEEPEVEYVEEISYEVVKKKKDPNHKSKKKKHHKSDADPPVDPTEDIGVKTPAVASPVAAVNTGDVKAKKPKKEKK